jgi:hypothetical protein
MSSGRASITMSIAVMACAAVVAACSTETSEPATTSPVSAAEPASAPAEAASAPAAQETPRATQGDRDRWATHAPDLVDADLPPLPVTPYPAARPMDVVRAVYVFAAKHPEVLSHVPCFCGCESRGHRHNDDCFVSARDAKGRPTKWEPHGVG